ncbi:MAG: DMT family transporter [Bacteroidaceae bacterium]|nr:DMT family transporter [Bacteroidaceae bacterium]
MWLILAFVSAFLLGFYDVFKKQSLRGNAVIPVLFFSTLISSCIFLPLILLSAFTPVLDDTLVHVPVASWEVHKYILLKACIVSASWTFGYFGMKNLPITIVGTINATRPVMVLLGALLIFGERLNAWQWIGVAFAIISFYMLSLGGKKEGIDFKHNKWIWFAVTASLLGAISALYDKALMRQLDNMLVQAWCNVYIMLIMCGVMFVLWYPKRKEQPFQWRWTILLISLFLTVADFAYFKALSEEGSMISIVSMVRRGNVIISFLCGALFLHEKNIKSKLVALVMVLIGLVFLYFGTR